MSAIRFGAANRIGESKFAGMSDTDSGLTATAGGGQSGALALTAQSNYVTTVASGNDSVALPKIVLTPGQLGSVGTMIFVANAGANTLKVYGKTPDTINASATGTGVTVATGVNVWFVAVSYDAATGIGLWRMTNAQAASVAAITSGTITGVTIDNSVIGGTTPVSAHFTAVGVTGTLTATNVTVSSALAVSGNVTLGSTASLLSLYGVTPVSQAAAITTISISAGITGAVGFTATQAAAIITAINSLIAANKGIGVTL